MDDPDYILNSGKTALQWGLVHHADTYEHIFDRGSPDGPDCFRKRSCRHAVGAGGSATRARGSLALSCWLHIDDSLLAGNQARAKAFVAVLEAPDRTYLDLQFWFFYPFNGPGQIFV